MLDADARPTLSEVLIGFKVERGMLFERRITFVPFFLGASSEQEA